MWLVFGAAALILAMLNIYQYTSRKPTKWFRFLSLAMTAFTVCSFYGHLNVWVEVGDWAVLMDVVPFMAKAIWVLVGASVVINGITLFEKKQK